MNGPKLWSDVIWSMGFTPRDIVIAGGCIRDWMLGVPEKDIDVFYKMADNQARLALGSRWTDDLVNPQPPEFGDGYEGLTQILDITNKVFNGHNVQLIRLDHQVNIDDYVAEFDITLCKGKFRAGATGLQIEAAMARDLEAKQIFCEGQTNQTSVRARRFLEKISQYEQGWVIENDPVHNAPDGAAMLGDLNF